MSVMEIVSRIRAKPSKEQDRQCVFAPVFAQDGTIGIATARFDYSLGPEWQNVIGTRNQKRELYGATWTTFCCSRCPFFVRFTYTYVTTASVRLEQSTWKYGVYTAAMRDKASFN